MAQNDRYDATHICLKPCRSTECVQILFNRLHLGWKLQQGNIVFLLSMLWWADDRYEYGIHFCDIFPLGPRLSLKVGEEQRTRVARMNMCMMVNKNIHVFKYVISRKIFYKYFQTYFSRVSLPLWNVFLKFYQTI